MKMQKELVWAVIWSWKASRRVLPDVSLLEREYNSVQTESLWMRQGGNAEVDSERIIELSRLYSRCSEWARDRKLFDGVLSMMV